MTGDCEKLQFNEACRQPQLSGNNKSARPMA